MYVENESLEALIEQNIPNDEVASAIALVKGQPVIALPKDLYIPPDALQIFLEVFTGPLDLLLYLIKKQDLDIANLPIAKITDQYMVYIDLIQGMRFELAAEYLLMAATLAEIKSRFLLPHLKSPDEKEEEDPRLQLIQKLQAYEQMKSAAESFNALPRLERDFFQAFVELPAINLENAFEKVSLIDLCEALKNVLKQHEWDNRYEVKPEGLSLREKMSHLLSKFSSEKFLDFVSCFDVREGRAGVVLTFLAILELIRQQLIEVSQVKADGPIYVRARG